MKIIKERPNRQIFSQGENLNDENYKKNKINFKEIDMTKKDEDLTAVEFIEKKYPVTSKEFKSLQDIQYRVFCEKQMDYGPSNISVGSNLETDADIKLSLTGLWFRMNDKIQRIKNILMNNRKVNNESIADSYLDISNYGIMATIVKNGKWGK